MTPSRRYPRTARLNEAMLEVLADEVERLSDPRLELVTITGVEVTRDLSRATVFFSTLGAETGASGGSRREGAQAALRAAASHLRAALGRELRVRQVPELEFRVDHGILAGQRIDEILRGETGPGRDDPFEGER